MKPFNDLISVQEAAAHLKISEELVMKFIKNGIIKAIAGGSNAKLTQYSIRRLGQAIELHEQCLPTDIIEYRLNN